MVHFWGLSCGIATTIATKVSREKLLKQSFEVGIFKSIKEARRISASGAVWLNSKFYFILKKCDRVIDESK